MAISYATDRDLMCPVIVCDACGQRITGAGNVYWLALDTGELHPGIWHTHKWPCANLDKALQRELGGLCLFEELHVWLAQLAHNAQTEASR